MQLLAKPFLILLHLLIKLIAGIGIPKVILLSADYFVIVAYIFKF